MFFIIKNGTAHESQTTSFFYELYKSVTWVYIRTCARLGSHANCGWNQVALLCGTSRQICHELLFVPLK